MADAATQPPGQPASPQGQSPPGSSPATQPIANRGQEAAGLATLSLIVDGLLKLATTFGANSDIGRAVLKSVTDLSKHVPPGTVSPGAQNNAMQNMMRTQQQQRPMAALGAAQGGQPGQPPQAQPPPG